MKLIHTLMCQLALISWFEQYSHAVINVTLTGTTTRHVCKGENIDFKWTYDETDSDKDFIKTIQWSKDPSGYLIMEYESGNYDITSSPNDYTGRVVPTTAAGSNDIGMRLKQAGSTDVDDEGKYYVSLIVDKPGGDADDYFVPYRDPQGVQVYVCVGVDDTYPLPSLSLTYDETTHVLNCSGPTTLGNTTFAIFDPRKTTIVTSTTDIILTKDITADRAGGTYRCKTYCTRQGSGGTPQGTCLPTEATLVLPAWSSWDDWTNCTTPGDSRTRTRYCNNPSPDSNGPQNCPGSDSETEICPTPPPTQPVPVNGSWSDWGNWTMCSVTCDNGTQTRNRECDNPPPQNGGDNCTGANDEIMDCFEGYCPVHGDWGNWTDWTPCSVTCDNGTQTRNRECNNPAPEYGGDNCTGDYDEVIDCFEEFCPVNGSWGNWTVWTPCSVTCDNGTQTRNRECDNPEPEYGGENCTGASEETMECFEGYCPVNGSWGNWTDWTPCSFTCGNGTQTRTRDCDNPEPEYGGENCTGNYEETVECFEKYCPVNGSWASWTVWTPCSVTCDNGTQTRNRECDDPAPEYGGDNCTGSDEEVMDCLEEYCPVNGSWGQWADWTPCSETCDNGTQTRNRECNNPEPEYGGDNCTGDYDEVIDCFEGFCPVNGSWGSWTEWGECPVDCGISTRTRSRFCNDPPPAYGGDNCQGRDGEQEECNTPLCISSISPVCGPESGGTDISVNGSLGDPSTMDITLYIGNRMCTLKSHEQNVAVFTIPAYASHGEDASQDQPIMITIGGDFTLTWNDSFSYFIVSDVKPGTCDIRAGTVQTVSGSNLDCVANPQMIVDLTESLSASSNCIVFNGTTMTCPCPSLSNISRRKRATRALVSADLYSATVSFILDGITISDIANLTYYATVELEIFQSNYELSKDDKIIIIKGTNLTDGVSTSDYVVKIDEHTCTDVQVTTDTIQCILPDDIIDNIQGTSARVVVYVGDNVEFNVGLVEFPASNTDSPEIIKTTLDPPKINNTTIGAIIGGVIAGLILLAVAIIIVYLVKRSRRKRSSYLYNERNNYDVYPNPAQHKQPGRDVYRQRRSTYRSYRPRTRRANSKAHTRSQARRSLYGNERSTSTDSTYYSRGLAYTNSYQGNGLPIYNIY